MEDNNDAAENLQRLNIADQTITTNTMVPQLNSPLAFDRITRHSFGDLVPGEFPLAGSPSIVLHILTSCELDPQDLAKLEASCSFFRRPAQFPPYFELSLSEVAAFDMCQKRAVFRHMCAAESLEMKIRCGGSWKLVLKFLLAGEVCYRREKSQAIAGAGHSIGVTSKGVAYSFGHNTSGQLGHGITSEEESRPRPISSLQGIRIIQVATGYERTMLISENGKVYAFGKAVFGETGEDNVAKKIITTPRLVKALQHIFIVQATIGSFCTAVLSREGKVYTFSWGKDARLGHRNEPSDVEPEPLMGALENLPVVQIAAGFCYLLVLAFQPTGMSVYSLGCGLGGKLGHGTNTDEKYPRLIVEFQLLNFQPRVIAAGCWHGAAVARDGRVCTWGWGRDGCLGHGGEENESKPKVVEALNHVKAVYVTSGDHTSFVISDSGEVYSFGSGDSSSLGHNFESDDPAISHAHVPLPLLITSLQEKIVHMSTTNSAYWTGHTFALTESGKVYAFGAGDKGQLGVALLSGKAERGKPELVDIGLS